jgi:hypothetical protein
MELADLKEAVTGLGDKPHNDRITILGWWLHTHKKKSAFTGADISKCYSDLNYPAPSSFGGYFQNLVTRKDIIKVNAGYKLGHKIREKLDAAYGQSATTIKVTDLLTGLTDKIPDMAERAYYQEALICYKDGSLRAAVVMTWNIAFSHLCDHILAKRLAGFNARWLISYPGMHKGARGVRTIASFDDLIDELKESEVLLICRDAGIITKNIYNIMHAALGKRNAAAHPNAVIIGPLQADAHITDLITNVVHAIV